MKEIYEFRINFDYAHLLFKSEEGKDLGYSVKEIYIMKDDTRFYQIPILDEKIRNKFKTFFFSWWHINRKYTRKEIESAKLFHILFKSTFEPPGEDCGTIYDEEVACKICGANAKQIGPLKLKLSSVPKKDISRSIAGEIVVSEKFVEVFTQNDLKGADFEELNSSKVANNFYQIKVISPRLNLTSNTLAGVNPFDFSEVGEPEEFTIPGGYNFKIEKEIYKCPNGDNIGLNLISEPYVLNEPSITQSDIFISNQTVGVKQGYLRPEPLYLCSPRFRKLIEENKLTGFKFDVAHIE
ncbi:MAG: hypothetical protein HZB41_14920 [Ignavibacteriae bacterium]|nr:hypothetical protein [Ignavibacteriota bacterium]